MMRILEVLMYMESFKKIYKLLNNPWIKEHKKKENAGNERKQHNMKMEAK